MIARIVCIGFLEFPAADNPNNFRIVPYFQFFESHEHSVALVADRPIHDWELFDLTLVNLLAGLISKYYFNFVESIRDVAWVILLFLLVELDYLKIPIMVAECLMDLSNEPEG